MPTAGVARVLIDSPLPQLDRLFDFVVPESMAASARQGVRVRVPFRSAGRVVNGFIIERTDHSEHAGRLSELEAVTSPAQVVPPQLWRLVREVADRAAGGAMDVLRVAVPPRYVRAEKTWLAAEATASITPCSRCVDDDALDDALAAGGRVTCLADPQPALNADGRPIGAWATDLAARACRMLARGRSSVLVVPDYRDRQQLAEALRAHRPDDGWVRLDAQQTGHARYRSYLRCLEATPVIVVGNRSAVYAPVAELGLLALWDDDDPLLGEPLAPYAHARDVALVRQRQSGAALLMTGHCRSVQVQRLVEVGWLTAMRPARPHRPRVILTAHQDGASTSRARIPSAAWKTAREAVDAGPVLIQVARPGYAPSLACARCRTPARCDRCAGPLGRTGQGARAACSWCGAQPHNWTCSVCEGTDFAITTTGSARTAEELGRAFAPVRVILSDGDHPLTTVSDEPQLVVATPGAEPHARGGYRAVLLLDGERMLLRESLNASADCVRWWANAAGLARRDAPVVLVGVGERLGIHLATWELADFAHQELTARRELSFPPAVRLASVTGAPEHVRRVLDRVAGDSILDVLGPTRLDDTTQRALVRFPYATGPRVAQALRSGIIEVATSTQVRQRQRGAARRAPSIRIRMDDPTVL